jgi:dipeptidyl aminopeptidase/acylaminoacyl peptidase
MAPGDILRLANVSDAQISPNGEWIVYSLATVNDDKSASTLWLAQAGQSRSQPSVPATRAREPRVATTRLLAPDWTATNPRWSPDGTTLAFIANRDGMSGIWIVTLRNREPRYIAPLQTTNFFITYAGESLAWSPDSKRIAYISATEETSAGELQGRDDPRVIDRIQYKSRTSFSDNKRTHVWIVSVERPEPRQLTSGPFYDHALTFSPRGDEIAFLSNHETDPDANNNSDIFAVDLGGQVRQITETRGCEFEPSWSPDGKWIAYTATKREITTIDSVAEDAHVWVTSASGDRRRELTADHDRRARSLRWTRDSGAVLFLAGDRGYGTVFRVRLGGGTVNRLSLFVFEGELGAGFELDNTREDAEKVKLAPPYQISGFSLAHRAPASAAGVRGEYGPMAFVMATADRPADVWLGIGGDVPLLRLSAHNDVFLRSIDVSVPLEIGFRSFDGLRIQGWLMKPIGWRSDRRYPLILSIHGGPHGMLGWGFNPTFQVYAGRGYAVLYLNPRGSSGYGQKFSDGTINEWGGGDYKDLMAGVDAALEKYAWIDASRMGVTGGSYGGFMTNWIITQTPRFKAAVASASVSNLISFYSTSLYQDLIHAEFGGYPWDNYELLWQWSPMRHVGQVQTPTMFIHGEQDNDVHITQAEEMYMGLKRRGVETVFVRYPREGHGLREPRHRVDALERTLSWFDRFLQ